ncbi:MAG: DNA-3-methyladenine glycosylase [Candidatus Heimdallarchaeota archaeon LC_2]|nr:MAG: DNA-3-methyladenine glycosylase [Candidatus Heimdallarchaeota archaeon LC_2]
MSEKNSSIFQDRPFYLLSSSKNIILPEHINQFKNRNPELSTFVDSFPIELKPIQLSNFEAFCFWIIGQQISGRAANAIIKRFQEYFITISPNEILSKSVPELRSIGLSKNKSLYLHNLANFFLNNEFPDFKLMSSREIIAYFSQIKGVGEWTVQMHLIFSFGRLDLFASKDLVVRKGIQKLYNLDHTPSEKEVLLLCEKWTNLATLGTILSWAMMGE